MATVTKSTITTLKLVETAVTENVIVMTITPDEAKTLQMIFGRIGGSPDKSRRGHCDSMRRALRDAGISESIHFHSELTNGDHMNFQDNK